MRSLLAGVLASKFADVDEDTVAEAAGLIERTVDAIESEIFLVPPQPAPRPLNRAQRRRGMCA
jgi:hypothetical protein